MYPRTTSIPILTILLYLTASSTQVNVIMKLITGGATVCINLLPGQCCAVPLQYPVGSSTDLPNFQAPQQTVASVSEFSASKLGVRDIAAVFTHNGQVGDCSNMPPYYRQRGPGSFRRFNGEGKPVSGMSYVRIPTRLPLTVSASEGEAVQGLLGLKVSGGGSWLAPGVASSLFGLGGGSNLRKMMTRKRKRGIVPVEGTEEGTVYIGRPTGTRYPDLYMLNGVNYTSLDTAKTVYRALDGTEINLWTTTPAG
ncbi:MAG: hypothetical protein Q9169_008286 [Polycauliona sp. 2 TL-2023]